MALVGCASVSPNPLSTNPNPTQTKTTMPRPSTEPGATLCERALKLANYNLSFAKQQATRAHVFADWTQANKALAAMIKARDEKNDDVCIEQARLVNSYIERSQGYIKWRNSLNL